MFTSKHPAMVIILLLIALALTPCYSQSDTETLSSTAIVDKAKGKTFSAKAMPKANVTFATIEAIDVPHDGGGKIELNWTFKGDANAVRKVIIFRRKSAKTLWIQLASVEGSESTYLDEDVTDGHPYSYRLRASGNGSTFESALMADVRSHASWFDFRKINLLIIALVVLGAIVYFVSQAGKRTMFIRRIAGLQAVEEAVGRATEMGRSVLFIPGIQDLDDVQTLAGLNILSSVAKITAEYETGLDVPVARSLVMSNGREVVKEAYMSVGRPDLYHDDIVHYVTDEQFGYVAAVDGIMVREEPAACFYMGAFFAESLILAETGNHVGAIQIAGTAMPSCDYTLIGEELFAAAAYLSQDQREIASLRGQDTGKVIAMVSILAGSIMVTIANITGVGFFSKLSDIFVRLFALNY